MCVSVFVCMLVFASFSSVCITVYHSVYLPVCLSCLSVSPCVPYLSVCQSVCIHTCQSLSPCVSTPVSLSLASLPIRVYPYLSVRVSVRVFPYLSVCQSVCIHTCQSVNPCVFIPVSPSVSPCVSIPLSLSVRVYPHLSVCQSVCIHTCQSVSLYVSIPVSLSLLSV